MIDAPEAPEEPTSDFSRRPESIEGMLAELADEKDRAKAKAIQRATIEALKAGHGIRVEIDADGNATATVDPDVPAGHIIEHPKP